MAWSPATPTLPSLHEDHSFRSDQLDSPRRHSFDGGPSPRTWMMVLYAATGIFQPLLVDVIKGRGGAPRNMLLPMLANVLGMALVRPASEALGVATAAEAYGGKSHAWARRPLTVRAVAFATLLDFAAGWLSTLGLLLVGAGGFIIVYAGGAGFTALLSYLFLGRKLDRRQVCGVVAITLGLALNSMISAEFFRGAPSGGSWNGTLIAVAGTVLHSGALVAGERALLLGAPDGLTPWALSSTMGSVEAGALVGYNGLLAALVMGMGALAASVSKEGASLQEVAALYAVLLAINTLHAVRGEERAAATPPTTPTTPAAVPGGCSARHHDCPARRLLHCYCCYTTNYYCYYY